MKEIVTPLTSNIIERLKVGQKVSLSGIIYTARDAAHKRLYSALKSRHVLPLDLTGQVIFYCGPTPAPPGKVIGACGPTTSSRMDKFTPLLLAHGLKGMIGKGERSCEVKTAIRKNNAVYFLAVGGAAALLSQYVKEAFMYIYLDLGPEAIYQLKVEKFPLIVGIDSTGRSIYDKGE
ncbi:MAG: FumA C-terminus/TtdB family hydratase beta subunit [Candidatus Omnitrophota bacterium]